MIPIMGPKNTHHFRHATNSGCIGESYLHVLGIKVFYQVYKDALDSNNAFKVRFPVQRICSFCKTSGFDDSKSCNLGETNETWNLTDLFRNVVEPDTVKDGEFKPDVLLLGENDDKIYIEIFVKHEVTIKKVSSGTKIIEIMLSNEDDIQLIRSGFLDATNMIRFINFPKSKFKDLESNYKCVFNFFVMDYKGSCKIVREYLWCVSDSEYGEIRYYKKISDGKISSRDYFQELTNVYRLHGKKVKNCFLCKYHALNTNKDSLAKPIFCKVYKKANVDKTCAPDGALKCGSFYQPGSHYSPDDFDVLFEF
jgi:hypothetical protein